ncbi:hypothetical protein AAFC00_006697 [Neodothiora populina]|uniref:Translation initiation factor IF-2, mitochondrial n=1 Tax=Neodothiora populina TaxID=2781224 RepID=A0ABR3PC62_9PEZI
MRNVKLPRQTSSSQSVCVFCACHLSGDVVATRSAGSISYAQRRSLSATTTADPQTRPQTSVSQHGSNNRNSPLTGQTPRRSIASQSFAFPDAGKAAREALEAQQRTEQAQRDALRRAEERAANRPDITRSSGNSRTNAGPRISRVNVNQSGRAAPSNHAGQNRHNEGSGQRIPASRNSNRRGYDPTQRVDVTQQAAPVSTPPVQAPAWMRAPAQPAVSSLTPSGPSWGAALPPRSTEAKDNQSSFPSAPSGPDATESSVSASLFGQLDASRQALAKTQPKPQATTPSAPPPQSNQTVAYNPFGSIDRRQNANNGATEPSTQRPRESDRRDRGGQRRSEYRIIMSDNHSTRESNAEPFDPEVSSNWSILRRNNNAQVQPQEDNGPSSIRTPQDIDAKFEEYRRRRSSSNLDLNNVAFEPAKPLVRRERAESRTCASCGKPGHIARNCPDIPSRNQTSNRNSTSFDRGADSGTAEQSSRQNLRQRQNGGSLIRRVDTEGNMWTKGEQQDKDDVDDDDEDVSSSRRRVNKPAKKFSSQPAPEEEPARAPRRSGRYGGEDEMEPEKPSKARRSRFVEEEDDDDDRPRKGRRGRASFEDDDPELSFGDMEDARARRMERKKARQAKKDKAAKEAARLAARQARKAEELTPIHLPEFISVSNLAQTLGIRYEDFITKVEELGFTTYTHDHIMTAENASLIAMEYNFDPTFGDAEGEEAGERDLKARPDVEDVEFLPTRPPVVAIMGHVDHGKTTILDFLRKSSVAATEHGGITQHIGAFSVALSSGKTITFLDTPGHAAFLEMRKRGANVTDIIILVVAADDSVKPQTIEAIKHAKAANVPIIVAINKIDKEEANIERVKQDLARHGVEIEDFGGDTQVVPVSGKTGEGIADLEDNISTLSEILDHRADTTGPVEGWVIEATTRKAGRVATMLVRRGTLSPGNIIVAGKTWTRVRTLRNEAGKAVASAGPGTPVEVDGWKGQPAAGDEALQAPNEQKATDVVAYREEIEERTKMAEDMEAINEVRRLEADKRERERLAAEAAKAAANDQDGQASTTTGQDAGSSANADDSTTSAPGHQTVPFIVKADVSGSVEAVTAYLLQMSNPLCSPTLLRSGVGPISEFDIEHAAAASGHIISFNLPANPEMSGKAEKRGVRIVEENVIYRIVGDVKSVLEDKLPPVKSQRVAGEAEVSMAFEIGVGGRKKMRIAGCKVRNGTVGRGSRVRVLRGEKKIYDGILSSLKNVKKDVTEMRKGTECGMGFDGWEDFQVGDQVQTYEEKVEKRTLQI